jgi:hypothetical protein
MSPPRNLEYVSRPPLSLFESLVLKHPYAHQNVASPAGTANVDWLELGNVAGSLAKYVFRVDTKAGQPPASCTPGSRVISVKYSAKYWFFN